MTRRGIHIKTRSEVAYGCTWGSPDLRLRLILCVDDENLLGVRTQSKRQEKGPDLPPTNYYLIPIIKSFLVQNTSTQSVYNFLGGIKIDCTDKKWLPSYIFLRKNGHEKSTWKKALTCFLFLTKHKLFTKSPFRPKPSQSKVFTHLLYV